MTQRSVTFRIDLLRGNDGFGEVIRDSDAQPMIRFLSVVICRRAEVKYTKLRSKVPAKPDGRVDARWRYRPPAMSFISLASTSETSVILRRFQNSQ